MAAAELIELAAAASAPSPILVLRAMDFSPPVPFPALIFPVSCLSWLCHRTQLSYSLKQWARRLRQLAIVHKHRVIRVTRFLVRPGKYGLVWPSTNYEVKLGRCEYSFTVSKSCFCSDGSWLPDSPSLTDALSRSLSTVECPRHPAHDLLNRCMLHFLRTI